MGTLMFRKNCLYGSYLIYNNLVKSHIANAVKKVSDLVRYTQQRLFFS